MGMEDGVGTGGGGGGGGREGGGGGGGGEGDRGVWWFRYFEARPGGKRSPTWLAMTKAQSWIRARERRSAPRRTSCVERRARAEAVDVVPSVTSAR